MLFTQCTKRCRNCPQIFSEGALDFSEGALEESYEKVVGVALPLGLFPSKRWKVIPFRASDGNPVILPMVLQIGETMVLQGVELEGKGSPPHFWIFGSPAALMGKHGFAEKLHQK
jgi:hypothetical protein